jgi:probable HAF family extracellular repeat protein
MRKGGGDANIPKRGMKHRDDFFRRGPDMLSRPAIAIALIASALLVACNPPGVIEDIGAPASGAKSGGYAINNSGSVAGAYYQSAQDPHTGMHAFLDVEGAGLIDIAPLPDGYDIAFGEGVNDDGVVVGGSVVGGLVPHAFVALGLLGDAPEVLDLGTLGGEYSVAYDINAAGQVTGASDNAAGTIRAFRWSSADGMRELGTLGGQTSEGYAINVRGDVAGVSQTRDGGRMLAFRFTDATGMVSLGTLPGGAGSTGRGINDRGDVVGVSDANRVIDGRLALRSAPALSLSGSRAFLWTQANGMRDLGHLGGGRSEATAINNNGMVVGWSIAGDGAQRAFAWTEAGGMIDLNTVLLPNSGWVLTTAYDANDRGQVTGVGLHNGQERAFRLTPPEREWFVESTQGVPGDPEP